MRDVKVALSDIADIRAQLAATTRFLGISPGFNLALAFVAVVVAFFQSRVQAAGGESAYILVWATVLLLASVVTAVDAVSRSRRIHGRMSATLLRTVWQKMVPFHAAGIMLTWVICSFAPDSVRLLPGLWQLLIGLLGFSVASNVPRQLVWVSAWWFVCGIVVLAWAGASGELSPWMMALPMAVGQTVVAFLFSRATGGYFVDKKS